MIHLPQTPVLGLKAFFTHLEMWHLKPLSEVLKEHIYFQKEEKVTS